MVFTGSPRPNPDRFNRFAGDRAMQAVVTKGVGSFDMLVLREVPVAAPGPGEALVQVLAAGMNNTDINTRIGWYDPAVTASTHETTMGAAEKSAVTGWNEVTPFPLIQGTDCCGRVVAAASAADQHLVGQRVLVRPCMKPAAGEAGTCVWMGSDFDGAFAQFVTVPASEVFVITCELSDYELGAIPCAFGTAENMLQRAHVARADNVFVVGASGGVGTAAVQLAKRRGATVTAATERSKMAALELLGADRVIDRDADIAAALGTTRMDVVIDNVAGSSFADRLKLLKRGGRYVSSGAIGGPLVTMDMRTVYLRDLSILGCTTWEDVVFANLVSYVEQGELRPQVAQVFPLEDIARAQQEFLKRAHFGKFVLIPPPLS